MKRIGLDFDSGIQITFHADKVVYYEPHEDPERTGTDYSLSYEAFAQAIKKACTPIKPGRGGWW